MIVIIPIISMIHTGQFQPHTYFTGLQLNYKYACNSLSKVYVKSSCSNQSLSKSFKFCMYIHTFKHDHGWTLMPVNTIAALHKHACHDHMLYFDHTAVTHI